MSKRKKDLTKPLSNQMCLLGNEDPEPGSLNIHTAICTAMSRAISKSGKSRYQIAAEMSELTGKDITKTMLDAYTAESHVDHRFPAEFLPAFLIATNNYELLKLIGRYSRCEVLESNEAIYAQVARLEKQRSELDINISRIKNLLK